MITLADLSARVRRLEQLTRGLAKEVMLWKGCNDPLLYMERRAYGNYVDGSRLFLYKVTRNMLHATGDTEIRLHQARAIHDASGADDRTYVEIAGADHYLRGRREEALELLVDWLRSRVP